MAKQHICFVNFCGFMGHLRVKAGVLPGKVVDIPVSADEPIEIAHTKSFPGEHLIIIGVILQKSIVFKFLKPFLKRFLNNLLDCVRIRFTTYDSSHIYVAMN